MKYTIDYLMQKFADHAHQATKERVKLEKEFRENYPEEPVPSHMKDNFNLPQALATICEEIKNLQEKPNDRME